MKLFDKLEEKLDDAFEELEAYFLSFGSNEYTDESNAAGKLLERFKSMARWKRVLIYIGIIFIGLTFGWLIVS